MIMFYVLVLLHLSFFFFFFNDTATTEIYTLSLHDALPISAAQGAAARARSGHGAPHRRRPAAAPGHQRRSARPRSEEHTSELQSQSNLVCRLLLEKKKKNTQHNLHDKPCTTELTDSLRCVR